jgi:hypothetical protein
VQLQCFLHVQVRLRGHENRDVTHGCC